MAPGQKKTQINIITIGHTVHGKTTLNVATQKVLSKQYGAVALGNGQTDSDKRT